MDKLEIARRQLGMALHLYIENLDPVSIHSLAGNAREIIDRLADVENTETFRDHALTVNTDMDEKAYYKAANLYRNAFKHNEKPGDEELLQNFDDEANKHLLFVSWFTYGNLCGRKPIEAQCFEAWYFAHEGDRSNDPEFVSKVQTYFGDMSQLLQAQRKERLKDAIMNSRGNLEIMSDDKTEKTPLVFPNE